VRRTEIVPRLGGAPGGAAAHRTHGERALEVAWTLGDGSRLSILASFGGDPTRVALPAGRLLFDTHDGAPPLAPWQVLAILAPDGR
jgi:hypothetical protein